MANIDIGLDQKSLYGSSRWSLVGVFTASIFLSAVLLFSVQPMFSKLVLPLLGGSSSVWNTAMVFFQGTLLAGYIYAHLISKYFGLMTQIIIHAFVLLVGCFFLPLSIASGWTPPETGPQAFWLIALFAVSVGAPFFAISANAPLLQRWFSRTSDKNADDPYFLYAASNAGSLLSLCLYPILFEPFLRLQEQTSLWSMGYLVLIVVIVSSGWFGYKNKSTLKSSYPATDGETGAATRSLSEVLVWVALAFIPSSLMLGVTSHITVNIASAPFLWIMPLALYLLTFIFAFSKRTLVTSKQLRFVYYLSICAALWAGFFVENILLSIVITLVCYFIIALGCHIRLVGKRPHVSRLTEFYIWMSLGGVLGGIFNALLAPLIFPTIYEYVIVLVLALFIYFKADKSFSSQRAFNRELLRIIFITVLMFTGLVIAKLPLSVSVFVTGIYFVYGLRKLSEEKNISLALGVSLICSLTVLVPMMNSDAVLRDRSFFGIIHVEADEGEYGVVHKFLHGDTIHNYQLQTDGLKTVPLAYYSRGNTFDLGLQFARSMSSDPANFSVSMIGLGAGAMSCYEKATDNWTYFEIDPAVVEMATNSDYFSYMQDCSYNSDVRIGDARLKFQDVQKNSQDYIIVDAFSSDSIPAHLVNKEALELYRSRLKPGGLIFFHTSNRVLDVSSVVVNLAENANLDSRFIKLRDFEDYPYSKYVAPSDAVIVGSAKQMEALSESDEKWRRYIASPDVGLWSDDYSHILGTLKASYKKNAQILPNNPDEILE